MTIERPAIRRGETSPPDWPVERDARRGLRSRTGGPALISLAWPRLDQDLGSWIRQAHDAGAKVSVMAAEVPEAEVATQIAAARQVGDVEEAPLFFGQDAGLIIDVLHAGQIVEAMVAQAEQTIAAATGCITP